MNEDKVYEFDGMPVTFHDNGISVNYKEVAKMFGHGKEPSYWLKTEGSKRFIKALSDTRNLDSLDLVKVTYGDKGGTWMHQDVAIEYARWVSPKFSIWCNDRIKELMKYGMTATDEVIERMIADPDYGIKLLTAFKEERAENQRLIAEVQAKNTHILALEGKVEEMNQKVSYLDRILACKETMAVTQIAQDYGMSAKAFNVILRDMGIQRKVNGQWILYTKYMTDSYVHSKSVPIIHHDGTTGTKLNTEWTQKGRLFLYNQLKERDILPLIER